MISGMIPRAVSRAAVSRTSMTVQTMKSPLVCANTYRKYSQHDSQVPSNFPNNPSPTSRMTGFLLAVLLGSGIVLYSTSSSSNSQGGIEPAPAEIEFEKPRMNPKSPEDNRDIISSQHLQVRKSWESPGVYAWGNNTGQVIDNSDESYVKKAKRIPYFDGKLLRDIKLDSGFGAAITENGDLLQWGSKFSPTSQGPTPTLRGKNLVKLSISKDRIIALSSNGQVYSIPASQSDLSLQPESEASSWFSFWKSLSDIGYRKFEPKNLKWGEKVEDISSGLEHCLMLTSKGRLFSAASASRDFPSKGQLGIPGLTLRAKPPGPFDQANEIKSLKGFKISKIATGDFHSVVLDCQGRVFTFGDNTCGQLGLDQVIDSPTVDAPSLVQFNKLYKGTNLTPRVTDIAAGGTNSYFTIDATRIDGKTDQEPRNLGQITADTWSCGQGIFGGLGNGRWTHIQGTPTKIKALSGLFEYDEKNEVIVPIRLAKLFIGQTHMSAVMNNVTELNVDDKSSANETNWGADVLWWGGNEHYQLGTGKRNNVCQPIYIQPLDIQADQEKGRNDRHRFHITPRKQIYFNGRKVSLEQKIECGRGVTAVYSAT